MEFGKFQFEVYENDKVAIKIIPELCKGCDVCINLCPANTLTLDKKRLIVTVDDVNTCIACNLCELRCPDFAIYIEKKNKK